MNAFVIETVIGFFAFDEGGELLDKELFVKKAEGIAEALDNIRKGLIVPELSTLISRVSMKGFETFRFEDKSLANAVQIGLGFNVEVVGPSDIGRRLRESLPKMAIELGYVDTEMELKNIAREVSILSSKTGIREAAGRRDLLLIQATHAIDELDVALNIFSTRVREWFGYHFPELSNLVEKHDTLLRLVTQLGDKKNFTFENLQGLDIPESRSRLIAETVNSSMGAEIGEADLQMIQDFSKSILELYRVRRKMDGYIEDLMKDIAPNVQSLAGSSLGARLISLAGGITNLSRMPASTIQVLGAEKALFRSIKTGSTPPKHGVIFQHQDLHQAQRWQRGKIARAISGKIAIAARIDAFKGEFMGDKLKAELEARVNEIKAKYPNPPARERIETDHRERASRGRIERRRNYGRGYRGPRGRG